MALYRFLENSAFGPEEIKSMVTAYEDALKGLHLVNRTDPVTEVLAKAIIQVAQTGERDPAQIRERAIANLGLPRVE